MSSHSSRRVSRVRHEVRRRAVSVVRTEAVGPGFISVTFGGDDLEGFRSDGFDDHVKFLFADEAGAQVSRDYTPRRYDADRRELTIEFVLHAAGPACEWARRATPGTPATIGGPKSSMVIPSDYSWHVLVGDGAALPAIARRLEELPGAARAIVLVRPDDPGERRPLASAAAADVTWLDPTNDLVAAVRSLDLPPGDAFVWCAGEAGEMARMRDLLLRERALPREAVRVAAYWKKDQSSFHETLASGLEPAEPA